MKVKVERVSRFPKVQRSGRVDYKDLGIVQRRRRSYHGQVKAQLQRAKLAKFVGSAGQMDHKVNTLVAVQNAMEAETQEQALARALLKKRFMRKKKKSQLKQVISKSKVRQENLGYLVKVLQEGSAVGTKTI